MSRPLPRVLLFGNPSWHMSAILIEAALRLARANGFEVIGICDAAPRPWRRYRTAAREVVATAIKRAFDAEQAVHVRSLLFRDVPTIARRFGVPVLVPPERDVNHPEFVRLVADELRPDWGLSLACGQIFRRDLLTALRRPVNYHNGLLPAYRGVGATAWSMYHDEPVTGFTFHVMNERIDDGPILVQGSVPVPRDASVAEVEWAKTVHAAERLPALVEALRRGDPGRPQAGTPSYFSAKDWRRIRVIDDPTAHTWDDLRRRLRSFDYLVMRVGDEPHEVTKLRAVAPDRRPSPLAFRTKDGVVAEPTRFLHLPRALYGLYRPWWPGGVRGSA